MTVDKPRNTDIKPTALKPWIVAITVILLLEVLKTWIGTTSALAAAAVISLGLIAAEIMMQRAITLV